MTDRTRDEIVRERTALRARYGAAYDQLLNLLFEEDPEGLNFGDNADEYDPEVGTILPRLADCSSADDVQAVISEEFRRSARAPFCMLSRPIGAARSDSRSRAGAILGLLRPDAMSLTPVRVAAVPRWSAADGSGGVFRRR
jgi:hypothetical protein